MSDPLGLSFADRLKRGLLIGFVFVVLPALVILAIWRMDDVASSEPELVQAEIISFGTQASYTGSDPIARLKLENDQVITVAMSMAQANGCSVGDRLEVEQRGINYTVAPQACAPPE